MQSSQAQYSQTTPHPVVGASQKSKMSCEVTRDPELLAKAYALRYQVFFEELGAQGNELVEELKQDFDEFDEICDHIVVREGDRVVGTYRMLPLVRARRLNRELYSVHEFQIDSLHRRFLGRGLELGRSCVHADYRGGSVPLLLWSSLLSYILENDIDFVVGCVSVFGASHLQALALKNHFRSKGKWSDEVDFAPTGAFDLRPLIEQGERENVKIVPAFLDRLIPTIMKGYFNVGAKVIGGPAFDAEFSCHDFLMAFETSNISPRYLNLLKRVRSA